MSNRFDDENNIEMDIKTAFASWGKYVFKCFPQECRLRSFLSEDSLDDSEEKNVDIINNPFIDSMVDRNNLLKAVKQIAEGEKFATVVLHAKEGTDTYRISFKSICFDDDGRTVEAIGLAEQLDERLNESEMVNALGSNFNSIYYVDVDNNKMYPYRMNPSVRAMFGEVLESKPGYNEMMEQYVNAIVLEEDKLHMLLETSINNLRRQFLIKDTYQHDYRIVRDGQVQYCRAKFVNVSGVGELHKMIAGFSDISPEKQRELERIAYVDAVTGGNNYESFKKKLRDRNVSGYLISMDIHSFKIVNSICGVAKGDEALRWISENIRGVVGYNDISGHINADRFVIFFADDKINKVIRKIETINLQLIKVSESLKIPKIQPYFGVTKWEPGKKVEEAYGEANFAKNRIKERKDVLYQIYSQADTERIVEEKQMEDNFYRDLNDNHFEIWYQPKYAPKTNKLVGAEGLVRWRRENNEIIPPSKFIPLFERNGMIKALDEYVFREVCTHQRRWLDEGKKIVPISINLSRASLYFESVVKRYHDIARRIGIYTHLVPIEITESAYVENGSVIKDTEKAFKNAGFKILIDDFGSGYSSLNMLKDIDADVLKLDMKFLDLNPENNDKGVSIITAVLDMARQLDIPAIAEGIETDEQLKLLEILGCEYAQGYYYYRPMPISDYEKLVDDKDNVADKLIILKTRKNDKSYHKEITDYFWKIADVDLDTGAYHFIRRTDEPDYVMTPRPKTIAEYADRYIKYGVIHPDDVSLYKEAINLGRIKKQLDEGKERGTYQIRYNMDGTYKWYVFEVTKPTNYSEDNRRVLFTWKEADYQAGAREDAMDIIYNTFIKILRADFLHDRYEPIKSTQEDIIRDAGLSGSIKEIY